MTVKAHTQWFHGSPCELTSLLTGPTVTPVQALAKAFSHKPSNVSIQVREDPDAGHRSVSIEHDGIRPGYLYRVVVADPSGDLRQHPGANGAPGEEVLTTRELRLELIEELPVCSAYNFSEQVD
jgi:hypothetical protein